MHVCATAGACFCWMAVHMGEQMHVSVHVVAKGNFFCHLLDTHSPPLGQGLSVAKLASQCFKNIIVFPCVVQGFQTQTTMFGFRCVIWGTNSGSPRILRPKPEG